MAELVKVKMLRAVGGFEEGDERELSAADAKRLEARGVVKVAGGKSAPALQNKMEPAPANKAEKPEVSTDLLKADLIKIARKEGVEIETDDNKADLVRKIEAARG